MTELVFSRLDRLHCAIYFSIAYIRVKPDTFSFWAPVRASGRIFKNLKNAIFPGFSYYNPCDWSATYDDHAHVGFVIQKSIPIINVRQLLFICQQNLCLYRKIFSLSYAVTTFFTLLAVRCNYIASSAIVIRCRLSLCLVCCLWCECIVTKRLKLESCSFYQKCSPVCEIWWRNLKEVSSLGGSNWNKMLVRAVVRLLSFN